MANCILLGEMERILRVLRGGDVGTDEVSLMYTELVAVTEKHIEAHKPACKMCLAPPPVKKSRFEQ